MSNVEHVSRKVDIRLPGKRNSNSHGARMVHQKHRWIRTSRLSIKNSLSQRLNSKPSAAAERRGQARGRARVRKADRGFLLVGVSTPCTRNRPLGPLGSSSSQHRRTLQLILQEGSAFFQASTCTFETGHTTGYTGISLTPRNGKIHRPSGRRFRRDGGSTDKSKGF